MTSDRLRAGAHRAVLLGALGTVLLAGLAGCASAPDPEPREFLDEKTAATVTVAGRAVVFAFERPDLGVNARDYVTLTGIDVNTSGKHVSHIVGYAWSTLDKRGVEDGPVTYQLIVEDRVLPLAVMPDGFRPLGFDTPPLKPPSRYAVPLAAAVSREALALYVDSEDLRVVRQRDGISDRFERWGDEAAR